MEHYISRCKVLRDTIYIQVSEDTAAAKTRYDADAFRKCKKSLLSFKTSIINMGKTLVEASLWTDVLRFCVAAAQVNEGTPLWLETSHNKIRNTVRSKLEHFAMRAATALSRVKEPQARSIHMQLEIAESCRDVFPSVSTTLLGRKGKMEGAAGRTHSFEDPMISANQLDIDISI